MPVAGAGYAMGKNASALIEVGDAAGKLFAKTAQEPSLGSAPIPLEEIKESIQEAQAREDIPGRAKRWRTGGAITGGFGGGVAGGALGLGARALMPGRGRNLLPIAGAAIGGGLGGYAGQRAGGEYGAEEARADKAVSMLRALRAHQAGAMSGYGAGMQRGYAMGQGMGKTSSVAKRLLKK